MPQLETFTFLPIITSSLGVFTAGYFFLFTSSLKSFLSLLNEISKKFFVHANSVKVNKKLSANLSPIVNTVA
jgi:hypothetical protein